MAKRSKSKLARRRRYLWPSVIGVVVLLVAAGITYHLHTTSKKAPIQTSADTRTYSRTAAPPADNDENNTRKSSSSPSSTLNNGGSATPPATSTSIQPQIVSANINNGDLHV